MHFIVLIGGKLFLAGETKHGRVFFPTFFVRQNIVEK
tara:strand:+ start:1375 stop:1485 length:111 start_codon:yes stop_codon:yes gene_type:complete